MESAGWAAARFALRRGETAAVQAPRLVDGTGVRAVIQPDQAWDIHVSNMAA